MLKTKDCKKCAGCPLAKLFPDNAVVETQWGAGNRLVIGDMPEQEDTVTGKPLSGGGGAWLNAMLPKAGVRKDELTILNVVQCRIPSDSKEGLFPTDSESRHILSTEDAYRAVTHCVENHVKPVIKAKTWNRIDLLGDKALRFIGERNGAYAWRGSPIEIPLAGYRRIGLPTLSPTAIAKDQSLLPAVINDLGKSLVVPEEHYRPMPTLADVQQFKATRFAFDIETNYPIRPDEIKLVGLCAEETVAMAVPWRGAYIDELKRIFADAAEIIGHNSLQFDLPILQKNGIRVPDKVKHWDTMLMQHLRFPDLPHDLEFVASQFTSKPIWKYDKSSLEIYNCRDVDVTFACWKQLKPLLEVNSLMDLYDNVQVPMAKICKLLQERGVRLSTDKIKAVREKLVIDAAKHEAFLPDSLRTKTVKVNRRQKAPEGTLGKSGKPVKFVMVPTEEQEQPWGSTDVIARYLYEELKLPVQKDPKKDDSISTGKVALEKLTRYCYKQAEKKRETLDWKAIGRSVDAIRRLRKIRSMLSLFAKEELGKSGIQHPHFNVHGTASGRLSSSDPNLQNIPESARFLYVPSREGWKIIDVDFSQIENRLTAWFANDKERLARFNADKEFSEHKYLASKFLGIPYEEVEKSSDPDSPYIRAKKIVHGTNYGEGALMIAKLNDLDYGEVKKMQNAWKQLIEATTKWQERTAADAAKLGYLTTPFGRKRWFYTSKKYTESLSFLPQSTAADIMFRTMIALMYERIGWPLENVQRIVKVIKPLPQPAKMLITVHDSLLIEAPEANVPEVVDTLKLVMEQPWPELNGLVIPIGVKVGDSWGEAA